MRFFLLLCLFAIANLSHGQDAVSLLKARHWTRNQKQLVNERAFYYPSLIEALGNSDEKIRSRAAIVLRLLDDEASIPALQEAFRTSKREAKHESLWAILKIIRHTYYGMHGEPWDLEKRSKVISDLGKDTVPYLVKWLRQLDPIEDYGMKLPIFAALVDLNDPRSIDELLRQTEELWMWDLYHCFRALVKFDDPRVIPTLIRNIYKGSGADYGDTVAYWFLKEMPEKAYPHLLEGVRKSKYAEGRWWCIVFLLSQPEDARTHAVVLKATADKEAQVRRIAYSYFAVFKYPTAEQAIRRGLRDPDKSVREEAEKVAEKNGIKISLDPPVRSRHHH